VKTHLRNLFAKLGVKTRAEAVEKAQVMRLL
jgi:ATP/maltotriose-dependent transcriptional regulator MalT